MGGNVFSKGVSSYPFMGSGRCINMRATYPHSVNTHYSLCQMAYVNVTHINFMLYISKFLWPPTHVTHYHFYFSKVITLIVSYKDGISYEVAKSNDKDALPLQGCQKKWQGCLHATRQHVDIKQNM